MKLNIEEQEFVYKWSRNYVIALSYAWVHYDTAREAEPVNDPEELEKIIMRKKTAYGDYKYWYGVMYGLTIGMSNKIRIDLYQACLKALDHLHNEAYGE